MTGQDPSRETSQDIPSKGKGDAFVLHGLFPIASFASHILWFKLLRCSHCCPCKGNKQEASLFFLLYLLPSFAEHPVQNCKQGGTSGSEEKRAICST